MDVAAQQNLAGHPLADQFHRLTPEQVLDAVEVCGERASGRFITLNSYENRVYQLELEDESWVVGKFYRPGRWSKETIADEHRFLAELAEADVPVNCPLELPDSGTIGQINGINYALFPRVGGRMPEELSDEQIRVVGRLLARIHNVGAAGAAHHRLALTPSTYGHDNLNWLESRDIIPVEARDNYLQTARILLDRIEPLFIGLPLHRIHGDCHVGNLLMTPVTPTFLDFDDMVIGPAVQDIWLLVGSFDAYGIHQREVLLDAYREFRFFDHSWMRLVEPLRALRFIHYSTWIARRWDDSTFKHTFSYFGTLQYWQREIQDLREQIARIDLQN